MSFDYIVIGAGSAGCVVASRLSEDRSARVLLLEAGGKPNSLWISMPSGVGKLIAPHNRFNWSYHSEPEPYLGNRTIYVPRGRGLGGSSLINGMAYVRGHPGDYDGWRQMGNRGWGWDDVLPYFKKSQHRIADSGAADDVYHATGGALHVTDPLVRHGASRDFIEAGVRLGLPRNPDYNGAQQEGIGFLQFTIRDGKRHSTAAAFLKDAARRPNLAIVTEALVHRITFDGKRATGVEYDDGGETRTETAWREVILCAGAIDSPKLLMLSGVGPGAVLQEQGVTVVHDLPGVGRNLQDHLYVHYTADSTPESSINGELHGWRLMSHGIRYLLTRGGVLTLGSSQVCAWVRIMAGADRPDMQIFFRPVSWEFSPSGTLVIGRAPSVSGSCSPIRPQSRGWIGLRSRDPRVPAKIVPNYLEAVPDRIATVKGFVLMRRIFATEPMRSRIVRERLPGPDCVSDDDILDHVRRSAQSQHHWAGSCKMGNDAMAVVDDRLRVHGVTALRIVDAAIMPTISAGNTNAPTIMIAEKGADLIKADVGA